MVAARRSALLWCFVAASTLATSAMAVEPLAVRQVAEGVYVHAGLLQDPSIANHGDVANIGFVVGATCVAVIDTGETLAIGRALRAAVGRVTRLPVCYVINTHVHPDHVFGNAAFADDAPRFVGHARLVAAMAARGDHYRRALERNRRVRAPRSSVVSFATSTVGGTIVEPAASTPRSRSRARR